MIKINPWMIITVVLILIIIGLQFGKQITGMFIVQTPKDIADKAINYINENLVASNTTATFVSVAEFNNFYNVTINYQNQTASVFVTKDGSYIFLSQPLNVKEKLPPVVVPNQTIGGFLVDDKSDVCKEDGKPIVYFFGSKNCPQCTWEDPIIKNVTDKFNDQISFHENIDTEKDSDILLKYSPKGYIPLIIIGCKYYRIGSGETFGIDNEALILTALTCLTTNKKPSSVCATVENILNQIR